MKLNVLLAKTEHSSGSYKKIINEYLQFFKKEQGQFKGIKKTYSPREGTADEPSRRQFIRVVTTVSEKLDYLENANGEYVDNLFSVEATNASGRCTAPLIVDGMNFGELSSLELLRLKSLLESDNLEDMYTHMPVRTDSDIWIKTENEDYTDREVYESPMQVGIARSITKESYILPDPNVERLKDTSKYQPVVGSKDTVMELGDYTMQMFVGETSHTERAKILARRSRLLSATIEALKVANEKETVESQLTAAKIFGYIHRGKF